MTLTTPPSEALSLAQRVLIVLLLILGFGLTLWLVRPVISPLVISLLLAYVLNPVVEKLEGVLASRLFALILMTLIIVGFIVVFAIFLVPLFADQLTLTVQRIPVALNKLVAQIDPLLNRLRANYPLFFRQFFGSSLASVKSSIPLLSTPTLKIFSAGATDLFSVFLNALKLLFVPVFTFYLLYDFPNIGQKIYQAIPHRRKLFFTERFYEIDQALRRFTHGQLLIAIIYAAIYSVGLTLLNIQVGLFLGVLAGLANLVPYLGTVVGLFFAIILSTFDGFSWLRVAGILGVFGFAQALDGSVLTPKILGNKVGLHPLVMLVGIISFGKLFGLLGIAIAVPAMATFAVFLRAFYREYLTSDFYHRT
ncbi:MAG: AI-2E family transporter [Acidobacteriia bacterium]|nr:AI-2E family transporter [Terriglobia bacterium]